MKRFSIHIFALIGLVFCWPAAANPNGPHPRPGSLGAVVPAAGPLSKGELRGVTSEIRAQLKAHGYRLLRQRQVRELVNRYGTPASRLTAAQLNVLATQLKVGLIVVPTVSSTPGRPDRLVLTAEIPAQGKSAKVAAHLPPPGPKGFSRSLIHKAAVACVAAVLNRPIPAAQRPVPATFSLGSSKREPTAVSGPPKDANPPQKHPPSGRPVEMMPEPPETKWYDEFDHSSVFVSLGFIPAWCYGDALCEDGVSGYGARLRFGYRIGAYASISVTGALANHKVPYTKDLVELASLSQAFLWANASGGLHYHPINNHFLDPYLGLDIGWSWMFYTRIEEKDEDDDDDDNNDPDPDLIPDYLDKRTTLFLNGFTLTPQIGLNLFLTRNIALGLALGWIIPIWQEVCLKFSFTEIDDQDEIEETFSEEQCTPLDQADSLDPQSESLQKLPNAPPRILNLDINLIISF